MKISARNTLPGTVKLIKKGMISCEVVITLANGVEVVSVVTNESVEGLGLTVGSKAYAVIKASSVMLAVD
ncbi:MAG TPA: TOBE domain-containing protein [Opitutales bacterium]|nr:TOBE domain-containing protein [Opitutales bacterium]